MKWNDLTLKERKKIYDSVRAQNPDTTYLDIKQQFDSIPEYEDGGKVINLVNKSNADFVERLKSPTRQVIDDWETQYISPYFPKMDKNFQLNHHSIATHKMSAWEGENGTGLIVPTVQRKNNELVDFSRPPYNDRAALYNALKTGDFVETPTYKDAEWFTQNYKKYYPSFEDGGKKLKKEDLPPEYRVGTPEYFERQRRISGRAEVVQPEAYITPAGYLKDAITTAEELEQGNYGNATVSALMNAIPWGVGKAIKRIKSALNTPTTVKYSMFDEYPSVSTKTKSKKKAKKESDYDSEFSEVIRRERNIRKYDKEINKTIEDAVFPDRHTMDLLRNVDKQYGTDYEDAYRRIAMRDMTNRGKYVRYQELPEGKNASISRTRPVGEYGPVIDDYMIAIDPLQYLPGTANHELGHLADQLASNPDTNNYLLYLLDEDNIMGPGELRSKGINISPNTQAYLLDPSEAKSHMLHLKRALVNEGKIHDWGSTVNQDIVESFLFDPRNSGVVNKMNQNQYNMYRDKSRFIQRMNQLTPMNYLTPMALPFVEYELNKE